jgi:hypothetical protein
MKRKDRAMEKESIRQFVVGSVADVPEGFIPLADFGTRANGKSGSEEYEVLLEAWRNRSVSACKVMRTPSDKCGPVYVERTQAARLLKAVQDSRATVEQQAAPIADAITATDGTAIVGTLRSMLFQLRRIGDAAEAIARSGNEWKANG